jgi:hypothetical protein
MPGATLTMENVTLNSPSMYNSEPEINVRKGASLIMKNCKIICDPFRMPIHMNSEEGGTIIAENCTFEYVHGIDLLNATGSFKNCTFIDCWEVLFCCNCESMEIVDCNIINSFTGITNNNTKESKISGNTLTNVAVLFPEPVLKPVSNK